MLYGSSLITVTNNGRLVDKLNPIETQRLKHNRAIKGLCDALPAETEIMDIFHHRSYWWLMWRESFGLLWGNEEDTTFESFATRAVKNSHPCLLGTLLVCLAFSTGEHARYLPTVERWILNDDELASSKYGFQCLMALGLCLLSAMQPRRAWTVYRRANTLLQLHGIHRRHRDSALLDSLFWQLFAADRWASLLIGLPYSVPENLCDLYIPPMAETTPVEYHYRHMTLLTGRVIDYLQSVQGPSLATAIAIDEQIDEMTAHLPPGYVDLAQISVCQDAKEKYIRIFRVTQIHQLKSFLYLPLFLQPTGDSQGHDRQGYARTACGGSARAVLEAFLEIYESNQSMASIDNGVKLTGFTALTAAVILFLSLIGDLSGDHRRHYEGLIDRTNAALEGCSEGKPRSLCGQCHTTLEALVTSSRDVGKGAAVQKVAVPYFGFLSIGRRQHSPAGEGLDQDEANTVPNDVAPDVDDNALDPSLEDIFWSYQGPWMGHCDMACLPTAEDESFSNFNFPAMNEVLF